MLLFHIWSMFNPCLNPGTLQSLYVRTVAWNRPKYHWIKTPWKDIDRLGQIKCIWPFNMFMCPSRTIVKLTIQGQNPKPLLSP